MKINSKIKSGNEIFFKKAKTNDQILNFLIEFCVISSNKKLSEKLEGFVANKIGFYL